MLPDFSALFGLLGWWRSLSIFMTHARGHLSLINGAYNLGLWSKRSQLLQVRIRIWSPMSGHAMPRGQPWHWILAPHGHLAWNLTTTSRPSESLQGLRLSGRPWLKAGCLYSQ
jgi:hypothetical protein